MTKYLLYAAVLFVAYHFGNKPATVTGQPAAKSDSTIVTTVQAYPVQFTATINQQ